MKKVKPETEIRNLKNEIKDLRLLLEHAGVPTLIIYFPQLVLKKYQIKPNKETIKWAKEKIKEYELKFPKSAEQLNSK